MSPRRHLSVVVPVVLVVGLSGASASALQPADVPHPIRATPRMASLGQLPEASVVTDGSVDDVVQSGDRVYALGYFSHVGRYTGPGRILDSATGADQSAPVFGDGQVSVALADDEGGWYLGGDIRGGLVHVLADGSVDPDFDVRANGLVSAIARQGNTIYIGGLFTKVNGATRKNLAAVTADEGALLAFRCDEPGRVTELVYAPAADGRPARLYAGGNGVSGINPVTGNREMSSAGFDGQVRALAMGADRLYVGTHDLDAIDPVSGMPIHEFEPAVSGANRSVHTLLYTGSTLYVGSDSNTIAGRPGRLVALDPETGVADATFDPEVADGAVYDLGLDGDRLWVGGAFDEVGGEPAGSLAVLDAATGAPTETDVPSFDHQVNAVELSGDAAYVGGHFYLADPVATQGLAALDATTLEPVPGFHATGTRRAYGDLVVGSNALYVAPTHYDGFKPGAKHPPYFYDTSAKVRAFDRDTGAPDPARTHPIVDLTGVTTLGDQLIVAQRLEDDEKFPRNRIIVYGPDGSEERSFPLPLLGYVTELATIDGDLLVAGSFKRQVASGPRNTALIRISLEDGERRAWFDPHIHGPVNDLSVQGDAIYASGLFQKVNEGLDLERPGLTRMDGQSEKSETFVPDIRSRGNNPSQRATAVGDLVWVSGMYPQRFIDADTGARVSDPTGGLLGYGFNAVTGDADNLVVGSEEWTHLAGQGYLEVGWISRFAR